MHVSRTQHLMSVHPPASHAVDPASKRLTRSIGQELWPSHVFEVFEPGFWQHIKSVQVPAALPGHTMFFASGLRTLKMGSVQLCVAQVGLHVSLLQHANAVQFPPVHMPRGVERNWPTGHLKSAGHASFPPPKQHWAASHPVSCLHLIDAPFSSGVVPLGQGNVASQ